MAGAAAAGYEPFVASPLISVEGVSHDTRARGAVRHALRDISFELFPGELITLEGRPGAGTTTLLHLVAGLIEPDEGRIAVDGEGLAAMSGRRREALRRGTLALVPEGGGLMPALSLAENVDLALRIAGTGLHERGARVSELFAAAGLEHVARRRPSEVGPSERRLAAISRALAVRPRVLLADEPAAGASAAATEAALRLLRTVTARDGVVLLATDDPDLAAAADRRLPLVDGGLHAPAPGAARLRTLPLPGDQAAR